MKKLITSLFFIFFLSSNVASADLSLFDVGSPKDWTYSVAYNIFTAHHGSEGFTSKRTGEEVPYNEDNDFIGLRVNFNDRFGAFAMKGLNSYYKTSYGAGVEISLPSPVWELGTDIGMMSGYDELISFGFLPFVNPFIRYNYKLSPKTKISARFGSMNFMAENLFLEYTVDF